MSDPVNEPKETPSVKDTINNFFDNLEAKEGEEQPPVSSPENEQPEETPESESDSPKTPSPEDPGSFRGVDKGFANHPVWKEREQKLKDAEAKIKELEGSSSVYARLLDDPHVYKKFLEAQGFSKEEIESSMADKGFESEPEVVRERDKTDEAALSDKIAEEICKEAGWDIRSLDKEKKEYINDQIKLTKAVIDRFMSEKIDSRMKPMEGYLREVEIGKKVSSDYDKAKTEAKKEFPELDWEKDIEPAMTRYLDDLDKRDPKGNIRIDAVTLYEKATRQLLKEKRIKQERQEVRDGLKANAKPLLPRSPVPSNGNSQKGKTVRETAENFLTSIGFKE